MPAAFAMAQVPFTNVDVRTFLPETVIATATKRRLGRMWW